MNRLRTITNCWVDELRLIQRIWKDEYPDKIEWRLSYLEKFMMSILVAARVLSLSPLKRLFLIKETRTQLSEAYVIVWLLGLVALLVYPFTSFFYALLIVYRLVEGFCYRLCIIFVDSYEKEWSLRSQNRSLMLLLINYFEMIIGFAALYRWAGSIKSSDGVITDAGNAFYFSIVTISTLGYGDYVPGNALGKVIVSVETIMGIVFIILVFSTFISRFGRSGANDAK